MPTQARPRNADEWQWTPSYLFAFNPTDLSKKKQRRGKSIIKKKQKQKKWSKGMYRSHVMGKRELSQIFSPKMYTKKKKANGVNWKVNVLFANLIPFFFF